MYTVNFIIRNNPSALTAAFKAHKNAEDLYKKALASTGKIEVEDDYGLKLAVDMSEVCGITFSSYEDDMDKNMEFQLIQHKAQLKAQNKAKSDVGLQLLSNNANPILKQN